jgi:MSHA pilin protein MshD
MGSHQMVLSVLAMLLLSISILTVNRQTLTTNDTMMSSRYGLMALSLANSIIQDASGLAFDEKTVVQGSSVNSVSQLTASTALGLDSGESASNPNSFDDFDDYNCYRTTPKTDVIIVDATVTPNKTMTFYSLCRVDYVDGTNPSNVMTTQTWHKRLMISVYSNDIKDPWTGLVDTLKLSTVYSYYYYPH